MHLGLNIQKLHILGILGTPVPVHLGPIPVQVAFCRGVPAQVGPVPVQVGFWWGCTGTALYLYRYSFGKLPRFASFATFDTNSLHITSPFLNTSKIIMEIIQNNFTTLELVVWNSYHKTLGENLMNSTKGPPILHKTIKL